MNLNNQLYNQNLNLLPFDGTVNYFGRIFSVLAADAFFKNLSASIAWRNDEVVLFGRRIITKRKVSWYGDKPYSYKYSNTVKEALPWTNKLLELKKEVEEKTEANFNSCLVNLYHNGDEGMGWHSDDEKSLVQNSVIASLSFGAERKFVLKHKKNKESISLILENGSLLVMKDTTQSNWMHSLPKSKKVTQPRINLTFRMMTD
ncbi:MAG: alpha-ketoglutarate-dependent dioxygenase AlkB [Flavobacterium sp.]|nr:alpha-ketoglutarate-dependent dioxygenase AlkB [Pedobacter sp.]